MPQKGKRPRFIDAAAFEEWLNQHILPTTNQPHSRPEIYVSDGRLIAPLMIRELVSEVGEERALEVIQAARVQLQVDPHDDPNWNSSFHRNVEWATEVIDDYVAGKGTPQPSTPPRKQP